MQKTDNIAMDGSEHVDACAWRICDGVMREKSDV